MPLLSGFLLLSGNAAADSTAQALDNNFKAALVLKLAKFVRWPVPTSPAPNFKLCLLLEGATPSAFAKLESQSLMDMQVTVHSFRRSDNVDAACNILYISPSKAVFLEDILTHLKQRPILTISEHPSFAKKGGMIELGVDRGKIRFFVNQTKVKSASLDLSAPLLQLSTIVD